MSENSSSSTSSGSGETIVALEHEGIFAHASFSRFHPLSITRR